MAEKITAIKKVAERLNKTQAPTVEPNRAYFEALMQKESRQISQMPQQQEQDLAAQETKRTDKSNLFEEVSRSSNKTPMVDENKLVAQLDETVTRIETVKDRLNTPNLEIRNSVQNLMRKRLDHADKSLTNALERAGGEDIASNAAKDPLLTPIQRFVGLLTQGQHKLTTLSDNIASMAATQELSPASLLAIQIKVGVAQHEIEFFTSLLNKALESTKTIMNVQV